MYRLLIVDDEPIIVDGLADDLTDHPELPNLELHRAYSAREALACLRSTRIDIVLTDIEMPEMNGLELQLEINRHWPRCKVIFLTGYNDFSYIQTSSRNGALDYVLKTEGDAQIVAAVKRAIAKLDEELEMQSLLRKASAQLALALPFRQREFLLDLLEGRQVLPENGAGDEMLRELGIPLRAAGPLLMIVGRFDAWPERTRPGDKLLYLYAVNNIAEEYLAAEFHLVQVRCGEDRFVWLLQPKADGEPAERVKPERRLYGYAELIQAACKHFLKTVLSFVLVSEPFRWADVQRRYESLSFLFARGLGTRREILLTDRQLFDAGSGPQDSRARQQTVRLLDEYLDKGQRTEFFELYDRFMGSVEGGSAAAGGVAAEIYFSVVSMLLSHINRRGLMKEVADRFPPGKLFSLDGQAAWRETAENLRRVAELLFDEGADEDRRQVSAVIRKVQEYVRDHLDGNLSLTKLSEIVYLSPTYLSKLYKQETGQGLGEFIMESRVQKAKELLLQSQQKIHKIARSVGFESAAYFTRCFKKITNMTPQEFRDGGKG